MKLAAEWILTMREIPPGQAQALIPVTAPALLANKELPLAEAAPPEPV